jgi:hypothetical protein
MFLEPSITLLLSIYSTGVTHYDCHMTVKIFYIINSNEKRFFLLTLMTVQGREGGREAPTITSEATAATETATARTISVSKV